MSSDYSRKMALLKSFDSDKSRVLNTERECSRSSGSIYEMSDRSVQETQGSLIVTKCPKSITNAVQDSEGRCSSSEPHYSRLHC